MACSCNSGQYVVTTRSGDRVTVSSLAKAEDMARKTGGTVSPK